MSIQLELDECYMMCAEAHAKLSKAIRTKVGACLVTPSGVVIGGCNGLASGGENTLEYREYEPIIINSPTDYPYTERGLGRFKLVTKPEVIHAELNCILKAAEQGISIKDSVIYTTLSPCKPCSEMLAQVKIKKVIFRDQYRCTKGLDNLSKHNIKYMKYTK